MTNIEKKLENLKITSNTSKTLTKKLSLPVTENTKNTKNNTPKEKCEHNDVLWLTAC